MDISNSLDSTFMLGKEMVKTMTTSTAMLLAYLVEKEKQAKLKRGTGEIPMEQMLAAAAARGDNVKMFSVTPQEWAMFRPYLQNSQIIKNYAVTTYTQSVDGGYPQKQMMIYAGESDMKEMDHLFQKMCIDHGMMTQMRRDEFLNLAQGKKIHIMENPEPELVELFDHYSRTIGKKLPYTMVYLKRTLADEKGQLYTKKGRYLVTLDEDKEAFGEAMRHASAVLAGKEQGPMVRTQMEYRLRGRQAINLALEEAERESIIMDKQDPSTYLKLTAGDCIYYENNKEVTRIPRGEHDFLNKVYDRIDGLMEPTAVEVKLEKMSIEEREKAMKDSPSVPSPTVWPLNIDENVVVENSREAVAYRKGFVEYSIDMGDKQTLEAAINAAQKEHELEMRAKEAKEKEYELPHPAELPELPSPDDESRE